MVSLGKIRIPACCQHRSSGWRLISQQAMWVLLSHSLPSDRSRYLCNLRQYISSLDICQCASHKAPSPAPHAAANAAALSVCAPETQRWPAPFLPHLFRDTKELEPSYPADSNLTSGNPATAASSPERIIFSRRSAGMWLSNANAAPSQCVNKNIKVQSYI